MAKTSSAKKARRVGERRRIFNVRRIRSMKDAIKDFDKLIANKDAAGAAKLMPALYKAIDKAVKRGVIKANNGARKKSRATLLLKKLS